MSREASWLDHVKRPSMLVVRVLALATLIAQCLISVTGATVRVTGSGLGCPTWPQCFPGSMVPTSHPEVAVLHQVIEFGNRMLAGGVGFVALGCFLAAWLTRPRRPRLIALAAVMPLGVLAQAIIGGMTVLVDLAWWSVSVHFMASAVLIWLATLLVKATFEGDEPARSVIPSTHRRVLVALVIVTVLLLIAGTLVTAAGPHAGDADTPRLELFGLLPLIQAHGLLAMLYIWLLAGFGFWLRSARPTKGLIRAYATACVVILLQGSLGITQYALGVPELLVVGHVAGATLVIVTTALLWTESRYRGAPQHHVESNTADQATR